VMCSATQEGLRRRRSKEDINAFRAARSATGPGKPYWKRPAGSTGGIMPLDSVFCATGRDTGIGAGKDVVDDAVTDVELVTAWIFFSDRVEYMAAVIPAPVAAETPAMIANVVLDMILKIEARRELVPGRLI
jgi:hypothetical protein